MSAGRRRSESSTRHSDEDLPPFHHGPRYPDLPRRRSIDSNTSALHRTVSKNGEWSPYGLGMTKPKASRRSIDSHPYPVDTNWSQFGSGTPGYNSDGVPRPHFRRTHSSLWEYWTRLGSGPQDGASELIRASSKVMREFNLPDESIDLLDDDSADGRYWKKVTSLMKYRAARKWIFILWILIGLGLGVYVITYLVLNNESKYNQTTESHCDQQGEKLKDIVNQNFLQISSLRGYMDMFFSNSSRTALNQSDFLEYMAATAFARQQVSAVMYAQKVVDRLAFANATGLQILDITGQSVRAPADVYGPVLYSYNFTQPKISGYVDVLQYAEVREVVLQASTAGQPLLSAPLLWLDHTLPTLALAVPFYTPGFDFAAANATFRNLQATGWLLACLEIPATLTYVRQLFNETLDLFLYDTTSQASPQVVYSPPSPSGASSADGSRQGKVSSPVEFSDPTRRYELRCSDRKGASFPVQAVEWGVVVVVITLLVAQLMRSAGKRLIKIENAYKLMKSLRDHTLDAKLAAEHADTSKSQFLATVSHEIRTPLNGVLGMLTLLRDTKLDAVQIDYVQTAVSSGKALIGLINDVLDFSKIEAGKMEIDSSAFDIRSELDDVLSLFAEKVRSKNVELAGLVQLYVPPMVVGDAGRFRQVLINLVGNATKFTEHGHILVTIRQIEEDEDVCLIHGYQPLPVGMDSIEANDGGHDRIQVPAVEHKGRKKFLSLASLLKLRSLATAPPASEDEQSLPEFAERPSGAQSEVGKDEVQKEAQKEEIRVEGEDLEQGQGQPNGEAAMDFPHVEVAPGLEMEASSSRGGVMPRRAFPDVEMRRRETTGSQPEDENSMTTGARYSTLSGWPTASGAHTHEEITRWMHQKPVNVSNESVRLAIAVEDTGQGIPVEAQSHIFQPFRQADSSTSRKAGGTGIGLSISRRLVELQGGTMDFVSRPGIGSTFFFDIALALPQGNPQTTNSQAQRLGLPQIDKLKGLRVLIVDSSKVRRQVLATHLQSLDIVSDFADNVDQAVHMARWGRRKPPRSRDMDSQGGRLDRRLSRTQSMDGNSDPNAPPKPLKPGGRRRSIEGITEAAKAIISSLSNSPAAGYFGSSPSNVSWSPSTLFSISPKTKGQDHTSPSRKSPLAPGGQSTSGTEDIAQQVKVEDIVRREFVQREILESSVVDLTELEAETGNGVEFIQIGSSHSSNARRSSMAAEFKGYAAIFVDSDGNNWEKRGLELGDRLKEGEKSVATPLILVMQKPNAELEKGSVRVGFKATLLKPLRRMSVAVSLVQALGLASSEKVAEMRSSPGVGLESQLKIVLRGRKILCVDDNMVNRRVAAKLLDKFGATTICASGGRAALDILKKESVDLVFMDLQMPEMDGYETSEKIRDLELMDELKFSEERAGQRLPVVAMTADVLKGTREKCISSGMDGYITKPIDTNELLKVTLRFFPLAPAAGHDA